MEEKVRNLITKYELHLAELRQAHFVCSDEAGESGLLARIDEVEGFISDLKGTTHRESPIYIINRQCEHVDPTYGRCQRDWGHAADRHDYYTGKER